MKMEMKKLMPFLSFILGFCFILGVGYTTAKYAGIYDAGEFILSLKAGSSGDVDPGAEYTLVYHTFDENGADIEYKTEKIYENLTVTIEGAPAAHSDLTFMGWSPQGSWIDEGEGYTFVPDPSDQKDNIYLDSYVPEQRILHTAFSQKTGGELLFLHSDETDTIHLYDLYEEYYVKFDGTQTSVQWVSIDFSVYSHSQTEIFVRRYWGQNFLTESDGVVNSIGYKLYGTTKTHYINPALSYYVGVHSTVDNGDQDAQGDYQYTATTTLRCSYNGVTETVDKETYAMWDGCRTFIPMVTNKENSNYSTGSCIAAGTLITMADGSRRPVEEVRTGDIVRVFDHETGGYTSAPVLFTEYDGDAEWNVINLEFSDGTFQKFIYEHGLFDLDLNRYVYITEENYQDFIGHRFAKEETFGYSETTLINAYTQLEFTGCYSLTTEYHLNVFVNGMFSMPGGIIGLFNFFEYDENLAYERELMAKDIETYGLFTYEEFAPYMSEETFNSIFPIKYLKVSVGKGLTSFEGLEYIIERYIYGHNLDR